MSFSNRRLAVAILGFLRDELLQPSLSDDAKESLEVSVQCLESAYGIDNAVASSVDIPGSLVDIFNAGCNELARKHPGNSATSANVQTTNEETSEANKAMATRFKNEGNDLMKQERFMEAIEAYSKAISLEQNAIYYCNRAAAFARLSDHYAALDDCTRALQIDPTYSKAYSRKGLAHSALEQHQEACDCFRQALRLEPNNEMYKTNLLQSEQKLKDAATSATQQGGLPGAMGGFNMGGFNMGNMGGMDFGAIFNNPAFLNMASQVIANPQMQEMMSSIMQTTSNQPEGPPDMSSLLQAGQQLASVMQRSNPELVEQLQRQFRDQNQAPPSNNGDHKPDNPPHS